MSIKIANKREVDGSKNTRRCDLEPLPGVREKAGDLTAAFEVGN
jgi:hypothetical protein